MSKSEFYNCVADKLNPYVKTIEIVCSLAIITGLAITYTTELPGNILLILALGALSITYNVQAQSKIRGEFVSALQSFFYSLCYMSMSIACVGILFAIQNWKGGKIMLLISVPTLLIAFLVLLKFKPTTTQIIRRLIILSFSALLLLYAMGYIIF